MQSNSCSVQYTKTGKTFDLMPLSDTISRTSNRQGSYFLINVCKPVLYGQNSMCPAGSSICLYSPHETDPKKRWVIQSIMWENCFLIFTSSLCRFINYGNVQTKPIIKDGQLSLRHESLTPCEKNSSMTYASIINFYCDRKAYVRIQHIRSENNN